MCDRRQLLGVLLAVVAALVSAGCGAEDKSGQAVRAERSQSTTSTAPTSAPRPKAVASPRFEGFVTGVTPRPVAADAKQTFVGGEALQFVFRDLQRAETSYRVCHRSSRGRSCRGATSGGASAASVFPPLLVNTDVLGEHAVAWLVGGRVVARATYAVTPEGDDGGSAKRPETAGREGDNASCTTFRSTKGSYTVQIEGFTESAGPDCATAEQTVRAYLSRYAPRPGTVGEFRCSQAQGGDSASGTFAKVTCTTHEPGQIIGVYRGA
jgi:hypothetical protein